MSKLSPLVGSFARPGAKFLLPLLSAGTPLRLEAEPENPYDSGAIKVLLPLGDGLDGYDPDFLSEGLAAFGVDYRAMVASGEPFFLGYIARQFPKKGLECNSPGDFAYNTEPGLIEAKASLVFAANGHPLVKLESAQ